MRATPSPDLISDILNTMINFPKKEKIDPYVHNLLSDIVLNTFSQLDIITIHYQMRNGLSLNEVFSKYNFNLDTHILDKVIYILEESDITGNNLDFLYFLVMHIYISQEILLERSRFIPPTKELLKCFLILSQKLTNDAREEVIEKVFKHIFISFLQFDKENKTFDLLPLFFDYIRRRRDQKFFFQVFEHISKSYRDDRFTQFLNDFTSYLQSNTTFFSSELTIFMIIPLLQSSLENFNIAAFRFLLASTSKLSDRCADKLISIVIQSIYGKILSDKPIQVKLSSKRPEHFYFTGTMTSDLNFFNTPTLQDDFFSLYSIKFPMPLELNSFFGPEMAEILTIISELFDDHSNKFINWYIDFMNRTSEVANDSSNSFDNSPEIDPQLETELNSNLNTSNNDKSSSHFYNMYLAFLFICSQFSSLSLSTEHASFFFHSLVFNLSDIVYSLKNDQNLQDKNFQIIHTLRLYSLYFILSDNGNSIDNILTNKSVITVPLFVAELFARLASVFQIFSTKIELNPKLIRTISNLARNYLHIDIATNEESKKEQIRQARASIFRTLAQLFTDDTTLKSFFNDKLFIHTILVFLFEEPVRPFILSKISSYLSKINFKNKDQPMHIPDGINPILDNISLHLPDRRYSLLLKDILSSFIEGFSYHKNEKTIFGNTCIIICHSMAYLDDDDLSKKIYELGITFLAMMSQTFKISDLEIDALITGLASFNDDLFIESFYPKFISLLAGLKDPPSIPNFIIQNPQVLKLLLQIYSQPSKLTGILDFISELCKYSPLNLSSCSKSGTDLILLFYLEKAKKNENLFSGDFVQKILDLYFLVTSHYTTTQSVLRYVSLLSPLSETTVSKYQLQFINAMSTAISYSFESPPSSFPLIGNKTPYYDRSEEFKNSKAINGQFTLTFWIYIKPDISENHPKICSIRLSDTFKVRVILSNDHLFIELYVYLSQPSYSIEQSSISIPESLSVQKWHFVVFNFDFNIKRSVIEYTIDCCSTKSLLARPIPNDSIFQRPQFSIRLGGKYKSTNETTFNSSSPSKIALVGIFTNCKIEEFYQVFELGLRNSEKLPFDPIFYKYDFKQYDNDIPNGFTEVLIDKCGVDCILPLFLQTDMIMEGKPFTLSLETIISLLGKLLTYSQKAQMNFYYSKGFNIIAELLTERWTKYFTFKNYQQLFQLLLTLTIEQLQLQIFDEVMTNFTFLMMIDSDLHLRILRHWMQILFPSFEELAINFSSFEELAAILRLFYWYKPIEKMWIKYTDIRPKDLNVQECRKYIMNLLFAYAKDNFDIHMFRCIISHCVSCTELKQVNELIQLLISILNEIAGKKKFVVEKKSFEYFVQYYMRYPDEEIRFLVLKLLILLHKFQFISNEFFGQQLDVIISIITPEALTKKLLDFLVAELCNDPFLFNLCTRVATYLNDISFVSDLFIKDKEEFWEKGSSNINEYLEKSKFWEIWFLWIAIYLKPDFTETLLMLAKDHLLDLLIIYDIFKLKSERFEKEMANFVISHVNLINNVFLVIQRLIAFSSSKDPLLNVSDFKLFEDTSQKVQNENKEEKAQNDKEDLDKFSPQNFINHVLNLKIEKPKIYFQLKFDTNFEWLHTQLAILFLSIFEKKFDPNFLRFDLLLCSFLQTTDFDVFDHLCTIYLHDKDLSDCDTILSLLEYHTHTNGKRLFLKNIPFTNPFPTPQKFYIFESQIGPRSYIEKVDIRYNEVKSFLEATRTHAQEMKHVDVSSLIERATSQMRNFIERQEIQNYINIRAWQALWSALSIERAPWHIQGKDNSLIREREVTASYGLAPVKMIQNLKELPFWQNAPVSCKIEERGLILKSQCAVLHVEGRYPATFYLFRKMIKIQELYGKYTEFQLKSIKFLFLRKNFGCQFFTEKGLSIHLEFPEDFFIKLVEELNSNISNSLGSKTNVFMQTKINQEFFQSLPYQRKWSNGEMSNYEYLLMVNHCAGRSFLDLQSYPFFPFVLMSSASEFDFRDFSENFTKTTPFPRETVLSYLSAIEPFKSEDKDIIDLNNFLSFDDVLRFAQKNRTEIVPEFYSMPEVLDKNGFVLPSWSSSAIDFIYRHRCALESRFVSSSLHIWLTSMFGQNSEFKLFEGNHPKKEVNFDKIPLLIDNIEKYVNKTKDARKFLCALVFDENPFFTFLLLLDTGEVVETKIQLDDTNNASLYLPNTPKSISAEILNSPVSSTSSTSSLSSSSSRNLIRSTSNVGDIVNNNNNNNNHSGANSDSNSSLNTNFGSNLTAKASYKIALKEKKRRESSMNRKVSDYKAVYDFKLNNRIVNKIDLQPHSIAIAKDDRFIVASNVLSVYDTSLKKTTVDIGTLYATSISADGSCIVAAEAENAKVSLIRGQKIDQTIQIYKDSITCVSVSSVFSLVAVGTHDGSVVVCSATSGNLICIIPLCEYRKEISSNERTNSILVSKSSSITLPKLDKNQSKYNISILPTLIPMKVLITPSWGFIVVYCSEISKGRLKHSIFVFTLNGSFVHHCKIDGPVDFWSSWSTRNGFDHLIFTNETGHVYMTEVFSAKQTKEVYCSRSKVIAAEVSKDKSILSIVSEDGKIALIPISV